MPTATTTTTEMPPGVHHDAHGYTAKCPKCERTFTKPTVIQAVAARNMHVGRKHDRVIKAVGQTDDEHYRPGQRRRDRLMALGLPTNTKGNLSDLEAQYAQRLNGAVENGAGDDTKERIKASLKKSAAKRARILRRLGLPVTTRGKIADLIAEHGQQSSRSSSNPFAIQKPHREPSPEIINVKPSQDNQLAIRFCPGCAYDLMKLLVGHQVMEIVDALPGRWHGKHSSSPLEQRGIRFCPGCGYPLAELPPTQNA